MFVTLTPNPVLDINLLIEAWTPGRPLSVLKRAISVGGKGLDASVALRHLGQETVGLHFAAGQTGHELLALLHAYGIHTEPVWVNGETRIAYIVAEQQSGQHTHLLTGNLIPSKESVDELFTRLETLLDSNTWLLTGGSLPPDIGTGFFFEAAMVAKRAGARMLVDSWQDPMLECLRAQPTIVKLNRDEFFLTFKECNDSQAAIIRQARDVRAQYGLDTLVITCGAEGILAFTPEGDFQSVPPPQQVVNAAGAGDAASAALAWRLSLGDSWLRALAWTVAVSAASVRTEGTADLAMRDVEAILPLVRVTDIK